MLKIQGAAKALTLLGVSLHTQHQEFFQAEQQGTHVQVLFLLHA